MNRLEIRQQTCGLPPSPLDEVNSSGNDNGPHSSPDGLTIYFDTRRDDGPGGADLYQATRPTLDAPFGPAEPIPGVNTEADETDPWVSPDGKYIVFTRKTESGNQLLEARR